jgi:hypothetical protein
MKPSTLAWLRLVHAGTRNPVAAWSSIAAGNVKDFASLPDAERNRRRRWDIHPGCFTQGYQSKWVIQRYSAQVTENKGRRFFLLGHCRAERKHCEKFHTY